MIALSLALVLISVVLGYCLFMLFCFGEWTVETVKQINDLADDVDALKRVVHRLNARSNGAIEEKNQGQSRSS